MSNLNFSTLLTIIICSFFFLKDTSSIIYLLSKSSIESQISNTYNKLNNFNPIEKIKALEEIKETAQITPSGFLQKDKQLLLGKISMLQGIEESSSDKKIELFCEARSKFIESTKLAPNGIEYQLAVADIESISPLLSQACNNISSSSANNINLNERLNLIQKIAPHETSTLYKTALILKASGDRINAMKKFREFEENTLKPSIEIRRYLISQVINNEELRAILPRKLPHLINWYDDIKIIGNKNISASHIFEEALVETLNNLDREIKTYEDKDGSSFKRLMHLYWSPNIQSTNQAKKILDQITYKYLSINSEDLNLIEYFKKLSQANRVELAISPNISNNTKKSSQLFDWYAHTSTTPINLNLSTDGIGFFVSANANYNFIAIQGNKGDYLPNDLKIEVWTSDNNLNYSQVTTLSSFKHTKLEDHPMSLFSIPKTNSKYIKLYFKYDNDKVSRLYGPINQLIQLYAD